MPWNETATNRRRSAFSRPSGLIGPIPYFRFWRKAGGKHRCERLESAFVASRVADLRETLRRADAVLLSTPEYAGSMPGSFENLLDWTVEIRSAFRQPLQSLLAAAKMRHDARAEQSL
jgi:multimeric flavodoxin WrbA